MITASERQLDVFRNATAKLNILSGPITSGKTYECNFLFPLDMLGIRHTPPPGDFLILGQTQGIAYKNIVEPILEMYGDRAYTKRIAGMLYLYVGNRRARVGGADNKSAYRKLLGGVLAGGYGDEFTELPEDAINQLIGRVADGGRTYLTTNPGSTYCYQHKRFIEKADGVKIKYFKFSLRDNPTLSEAKIKELHETHSGLWFKRYVLGLWVAAEGVVYDMFDEEKHTFEWENEDGTVKRFKPDDVTYGVDYGTANPFVILTAYHKDDITYIVDEYYFDSVEAGHQKANSQYLDEARRVTATHGEGLFVVDPSALSFKLELPDGNIPAVGANNAVLDGIQLVGNLLNAKKLLVHKSCKHLIGEFSSYSWDPAAQKRGDDKPLKIADHCSDALRYLCMQYYGGRIDISDGSSTGKEEREVIETDYLDSSGWG